MLSEFESSKKIQKGGFINESEEDRLRRDIYRSDKDKFKLFVQMLRNNKMYKRIKVTYK